MDGLRTELSAIVERSRIGDRKQQELEQIITRLEDEVARYSTQTIQLEERLADKMAQIASLESKLGQRNLKVVDLQKELEDKISENGILQREVINRAGKMISHWNLVWNYIISQHNWLLLSHFLIRLGKRRHALVASRNNWMTGRQNQAYMKQNYRRFKRS